MRLWIALAATTACTRTELATIDLSDRTDAIAFLAVLDAGDQLLRITHVFGVDDGRIAFGERPQLQLNGDEAIAVLVELDRSDLVAMYPDFVAERASEIEVRIEAPPLEPTIAGDPQAAQKLMALPEVTAMLEVATKERIASDSDRGRALLGKLTVTLPIDPEYCRPDLTFEPYGRDEQALTGDSRVVRSIERVIRLGDRVIFSSGVALHLLDRGGTVDSMRSWQASQLGDAVTVVRDFDVDPIPNSDGSLRVMVAVERGTTDDSLLVELRLDGAIQYVRTATQVSATSFSDVEINDEGRAAWLSREAVLYVEENGGSSQRLIDPLVDPKGSVLFWLDPSRVVATTRNRFHFWDRSSDRLDTVMVVPPVERSLEVEVLRGGAEVWAGANNGWLARIQSGTVEEISIDVPPRYAGCATAQGDATLFEDDVIDLVMGDGYTYVLLKRCSAVMAIRAGDRCVSLLSTDGIEPRLLDQDEDGLRTIEIGDGELLVGDALGRLFRAGL